MSEQEQQQIQGDVNKTANVDETPAEEARISSHDDYVLFQRQMAEAAKKTSAKGCGNYWGGVLVFILLLFSYGAESLAFFTVMYAVAYFCLIVAYEIKMRKANSYAVDNVSISSILIKAALKSLGVVLVGVVIIVVLVLIFLPFLLRGVIGSAGRSCDDTGVGQFGMFLLPLFFIQKWKWSGLYDRWRKKKR